jgi:hypothetical protein
MLLRSGENLFEGAKSFVDQNQEITVFSAYLKLSVLKRLNNNRNIKQIIVGWELKDLCLGVSDFESIYDYCLDNEIVLYRNTRIHLKALWNNNRSVLFGSANITNKGIGETNKYNFELNGIVDKMSFDDQSYLNKIILDSEYVTEELYEELKRIVDNFDAPEIAYPKLPTPPPTVNYFLINQLPMSLSPELLFDVYEGKLLDEIDMNCAAHDLELYKIPKNLNKTDFLNFLKTTFNQHPFIQSFKEAVKTATNERNPERNGSMQFGTVRRWFAENTTTVPTPRSFELNSYVKVLYKWICYFDEDYSWDIPGERSEVIYFKKEN